MEIESDGGRQIPYFSHVDSKKKNKYKLIDIENRLVATE